VHNGDGRQQLVLALNPCIDTEWQVDEVRWDEKTTVLAERRWAGGKGVNVARWLKHLRSVGVSECRSNGRPPATHHSITPLLRRSIPKLFLPLGGLTGAELARSLGQEKLAARVIHLHEATRVNVLVTTADGRQLRFNPLGPRLSDSEWRVLLATVSRALGRASALILSGSLPRGLPTAAYPQLVKMARLAGVHAFVDCDGPAFAVAVRAKPFLVKPNRHELAQWWASRSGRESPAAHKSLSHVRQEFVAGKLSEVTGGWVMVSGGAKPSLLLNRGLGVQFVARPPRVTPLNTLGAGDAMLAAASWRAQLGDPPAEWLRWGVAVGTAATQCRPGELPSPKLILQLLGQTRVANM